MPEAGHNSAEFGQLADIVSRSMLEGRSVLERPQRWVGGLGTLAVHVVLAAGAALLALAPPPSREPREMMADLRTATPLVAPPPVLTQKNTGPGKVAQEVNLEGLLSRPALTAPRSPGITQPAPPRPFEAPPAARAAAPKPLIEAAPVIEERQELASNLPPALGAPSIAAPRIEEVEKPKLAFERPGADMGTRTGTGAAPAARVPPPPKGTVEDAVRQVARAGGGGLMVGDLGEGLGGLGDAIRNPGAPTRNGSALELMSDPMGVDFRPYLIQILSTVRRNWFSVIPESARLGRRGKVQIQFAINRDGSVPKLVIALPSGTESLDRAAVAGISASNPFPPLPDDFKGHQVRLQFTFLYNIPR